MGAPNVVMTGENAELGPMESEHPTISPRISNNEIMEDGPRHRPSHPSYHEKAHLAVDTSSSARTPPRLSQLAMPSPMTASTPTTASLTPDSGASSSRRPSLRSITAMLPRSALQEETIALFKQYRNLIPCAKCFSRNTIQRDGMSDGNLRFKCRPPVSMSLICNKSYSESKIRNMIEGVVCGHSLPDSGTPTSAKTTNGLSENVLAMAPPPSMKSSRRPSQKHEGSSETERLQQLRERKEPALQCENSMGSEHQQSYEEMNINGGHPHPVDDRCSSHGGTNRRPSAQPQYRRPSIVGEDSPMMDYEDSVMLSSSGHLQVPGTSPLEGGDPRVYRAHSAYGNRTATPTGPPSSSLNAATRQSQKLQHSHSHPNIGQQRHQQYLEQQEQQSGGQSYSSHSQQYQAQQQQQQRHLQRQILRRESTQYHGAVHPKPEIVERRFSHPATLQPSLSSKFLPIGSSGDSHSPALLSSSRSSPGHESLQEALGQSRTLQIGSLPSPGDRYEEANSPTSYYQRRMSQPHPSGQRSYSQLSLHPSATFMHPYDRRISEAEDFSYQHREKYAKLNANTMRRSTNKMLPTPNSPLISHAGGPSPTQQQTSGPQNLRTSISGPMGFSHSLPVANNGGNNSRHAYLRHQDSPGLAYYQRPSREDLDTANSYAPDILSSEGADSRAYARMRQSSKKPNTGLSLARMGSHSSLYSSSNMSSSSARDLNVALPRNTIKLTCFPNGASPVNQTDRFPSTLSLDTAEAMSLKLGGSSKVVIEITQPRHLQAFGSPRPATFSAFENVLGPLQQQQKTLRHAASQPNMLSRSSNSVLRRRRSASPDEVAFGSSKKRRADSVSGSRDGDDDCNVTPNASAAVAEAAAAAVVAAVANAARQQQSNVSLTSPSGLHLVGLDYTAERKLDVSKETGLGLGVRVPPAAGGEPPTVAALKVAKASSYVPLEDQNELGIDYSLFTRVETAGWRILIPPNVVASFRSEDFGLILKPKLSDTAPAAVPVVEDREDKEFKSEAITQIEHSEVAIEENGENEKEDENMAEDITTADKTEPASDKQTEIAVPEMTVPKDVTGTEGEMDELEDE
ncbi:hypothetical protein BGZ58_007341 [Dissophora ornata]|nr:hypothetical protein BGZ58_007341 [Dissophora ornata]